MARWGRNIAIPPPRPIPWTMKSLDSARTDLRFLPDGRLRLHIRHDVLRGVTPAMLVWWFRHLEGTIEVEGRVWPRYHVWHPVDHIAVRYARRLPDGSVGPGAKIHIQEAFGGNPDHLVDIVTTIERLDEGGFVHAPLVGGVRVASLEYAFTRVPEGTLYENSITFGPTHPIARALVNHFVRPRVFPEDKARAWLRHNVEEVGNFQFFLPGLYAREGAR
jgi:hypothetical protein